MQKDLNGSMMTICLKHIWVATIAVRYLGPVHSQFWGHWYPSYHSWVFLAFIYWQLLFVLTFRKETTYFRYNDVIFRMWRRNEGHHSLRREEIEKNPVTYPDVSCIQIFENDQMRHLPSFTVILVLLQSLKTTKTGNYSTADNLALKEKRYLWRLKKKQCQVHIFCNKRKWWCMTLSIHTWCKKRKLTYTLSFRFCNTLSMLQIISHISFITISNF